MLQTEFFQPVAVAIPETSSFKLLDSISTDCISMQQQTAFNYRTFSFPSQSLGERADTLSDQIRQVQSDWTSSQSKFSSSGGDLTLPELNVKPLTSGLNQTFLDLFVLKEEPYWLYLLAQGVSTVATYVLNHYMPGIGLLCNLALNGTAALCSQAALKKLFGYHSLREVLNGLRAPKEFLKSLAPEKNIPLFSLIQEKNYKLFALAQTIAFVATYALNLYLPGIGLLSNLAVAGATALSSHVALKLYFDSRPLKEAWKALVAFD